MDKMEMLFEELTSFLDNIENMAENQRKEIASIKCGLILEDETLHFNLTPSQYRLLKYFVNNQTSFYNSYIVPFEDLYRSV